MEKKLITDVDFDGVDHKDYPDYCDAHVVSAKYNGEQMNEEQLDELNDDKDMVYELLMDYLY